MSRADYNDGRDHMTGEPTRLVPVLDRPDHFTDRRAEDALDAQADRVLISEDRFDRLRDLKLRAAIGAMRALIDEAESGSGLAASRIVQAASADLIIPMLAERLREARDNIPGHTGMDVVRVRIDAALAAVGPA